LNELNIIDQGNITNPTGFLAGAAKCGLKKNDHLDLAVISSERDCTAAGVFTKNQVVAAPVIVDRETLRANRSCIRAVVANAGNANACTGQAGMENARQMQKLTAEKLNCLPNQVLVLSTGVIGVQLPMEKIRTGIETAVEQLSHQGGDQVARAIMTTDTRPKQTALQIHLPGGMVTIGGMAKGSGMIHPNMATMLGVLTTDADLPPELLDRILKTAVDASFNRISVDGDTSTNDTVFLLANGASGVRVVDEESVALFEDALVHICVELAKMIIYDGEGATKFVEIQVSGCQTEKDAHAIAQTIATSPLVKTAFAGSDANWGRILAAAGRAGVPFKQDKTNLWIGSKTHKELLLVEAGTPTNYMEEDAAAIFALDEFVVHLELNSGKASTKMWTSDLTHDYISINADYRS